MFPGDSAEDSFQHDSARWKELLRRVLRAERSSLSLSLSYRQERVVVSLWSEVIFAGYERVGGRQPTAGG